MAVTRIWPVKGRIDIPLKYVENPEKTINPSYGKALEDVMEYAVNEEKTEKHFFVSGINCEPESAREQFQMVKRYFKKEDGIIAYHAYQSFNEGEVTPEHAHEIGKEFAERIWGKNYQVIVATHLNTNCLHNHFVINSIGLHDGKRLREDKWYEFSRINDEICQKHGLSIVEDKTGRRLPMDMYKAEQNGAPTRLNIAKEAVDKAISKSCNLKEFEMHLKEKGFYINLSKNRKYWTIKQEDWERPIRIARLGEEYSNGRITERIKENDTNVRFATIQERKRKQYKYQHRPRKSVKSKNRRICGLRGRYIHYCYLLGVYGKTRTPCNVHYALRDDLMKLNSITQEARLLSRERIQTREELEKYKVELELKVDELIFERSQTKYKENKEPINAKLKRIRNELRLIEHIETRESDMKEKLEKVNKDRNKDKQREDKRNEL